MTKLAKVAHCRELGTKIPGVDELQAKRIVEAAALSILQARRGSVETTPPDERRTELPTAELPDGTKAEVADRDEPTMPFELTADDAPGSEGDEPAEDDDATEGAGSDDETPGDDSPEDEAQDAPEGKETPKADALEARVRELITEAMDGATDDAAEDIAAAVEARLGDAVASIRAELGARAPRTIDLKAPALPTVSMEGKHPTYSKAFALMALPAEYRRGWGLALVGPAGSGKSTGFAQLAVDLGVKYGGFSCSADMTRGSIDGRILPIGEGRYVPSELARMIGEPGLYCLDEFDAAAPEIMVAVNAPMANGGMHCEPRAFEGLETFLEKHDDFRFGAAMNTWGQGATMQYNGRSAQDGASLDRWLILFWDHDYDLWARTMGFDYETPQPWEPTQRTDNELAAAVSDAGRWWYDVSRKVTETASRRIVSFRGCLKARACLAAGFTMAETKDVLLAGWTADERAQVDA
jgi:hypothetical protein